MLSEGVEGHESALSIARGEGLEEPRDGGLPGQERRHVPEVAREVLSLRDAPGGVWGALDRDRGEPEEVLSHALRDTAKARLVLPCDRRGGIGR